MSRGDAADQRGGRWRNDAPPVGRVVEIWWVNAVILAVWDGAVWFTPDGNRLGVVSHWRLR